MKRLLKKMAKKSIVLSIISVSLILVLLAGCSGGNAGKVTTPYEVKRGDLDIIVSSDGSLSMPNQFDLRFGTQGTVLDLQIDTLQAGPGYVLTYGTISTNTQSGKTIAWVEEGDVVKEGAILAFMDNISQRNAIRKGLYTIQTAVNSINVACDWELPTNYTDLSIIRMITEAQKDLNEFQYYLENSQYNDAGYKLCMTYFDLEVCEDLIKNRPDAASLAGAKPNQIFNAESSAGTANVMTPNDTEAIQKLQKFRKNMLDSWILIRGIRSDATFNVDKASGDFLELVRSVENTVHQKGRDYFQYSDTPTSLDFLQSSLRSLQELDSYAAQKDATADEIAKRLYIAKLNLAIANDVLKNQTLVYDWGSGYDWKQLQQYNIALQKAETSFLTAKQAIMNTAIIAPSDGTVVSVDLKKGYVLSAQDYSSRTAIKLVDTGTVKFSGMVDEIDILKVQPGQKATIAVDAVPDRTFTGTVKFISPFGAEVGNVVKFAITILLDPTDVELRGGLNATADISTYSAKNVLLVPISLVTFTPGGATVSLINEQTGQTEPRKITIGKQNLQFVEVVEGLKEGDKLAETKLNIFGIPSGSTGGGSNPGMMRVR